jgi:hypothetical protein
MQGFLSSILLMLTAPRALGPTVAALTGVVGRTRDGARETGAPNGTAATAPAGTATQRAMRGAATGATSVPGPTAVLEPIGAHDLTRLRTAPAEPEGIRVVPYRPATAWPEARRIHPRVYDPFRAFPRRASCLADLIHPRDPRD